MSYGVRTVGRRRDADQERTPGKVRVKAIHLSADMHDAVSRIAQESSVSFSEAVRRLLASALNEARRGGA